MRVGLIACCKMKADTPLPAGDLYQSPLFRLSRQWIRKRCETWGILSAKHGLVMPDEILSPYDVCLSEFNRDEIKGWEKKVDAQLAARWGRNTIYMILAGERYRGALKKMAMVEDVIDCWTQWRIDAGMGRYRAAMNIGLILKALKEDKGYY